MITILTKEMFPPNKGPKVELVAPIAPDWTGDSIKKHAKKLGIGIDHTMYIPGYPTPSCLVLTKSTGEISESVCDFRLLRIGVTPETFENYYPNKTVLGHEIKPLKKSLLSSSLSFIKNKTLHFLNLSPPPPTFQPNPNSHLSPYFQSLLSSSSLVVLDNNFNYNVTIFLAKECKILNIPLVFVPSTFEGFEKSAPAADYATVVHLNRHELKVFTQDEV